MHAPRVYALIESDRLDDARSAIESGLRISSEIGTPWHLASYQMVRAVERFLVGAWDDALAEVEASMALAEETGEAYGLIVGRTLECLIWLHRNDLVRARTAAEAAVEQAAETATGYNTQVARRAHALVREAEGDIGGAYEELATVWDECAELGIVMEYRTLGADLVRLSLAVGDASRIAQVTAALAEVAAANDVPSVTAAALRCRGLATDDAEILVAAAQLCTAQIRPLEHAHISEEAGAALARRGEIDRARALLERACEIYNQLGATRDLARAEAILRTAGIRRGRRGQRNRPQHGWDSLTATERAVVDLVAEGLTNPQIGKRLYVSPRTVQTHLAHVFGKLAINTRAQLAAEVARHAPSPSDVSR